MVASSWIFYSFKNLLLRIRGSVLKVTGLHLTKQFFPAYDITPVQNSFFLLFDWKNNCRGHIWLIAIISRGYKSMESVMVASSWILYSSTQIGLISLDAFKNVVKVHSNRKGSDESSLGIRNHSFQLENISANKNGKTARISTSSNLSNS